MKFCPNCGSTLSTQKFCQECGYEIEKKENNGLNFDFSALESQAKEQLYEKEGLVVENGVLVKYKGVKRTVVIPSTVEEIYNSAFENNEIVTYLEIQEGVRIIGENAFKNCRSLLKISIPSSCIKIYDSAFSGTSLEKVVLTDKRKDIVLCFVSDRAKKYLAIQGVENYIVKENGEFTVDVRKIENDAVNYFNRKAQEAQEAERKKIEEERRQEEARRKAEEERQAELRRQEEARRKAEEARQAELKRQEDARRRAEEERQAEIRRKEEARLAEIRRKEEEKRKAEEARLEEIRRKEEEKRRKEQEKRDAEYNAWKQDYLGQINARKERENRIKTEEGNRTEVAFGRYTEGLFVKKPIEWIAVDVRDDKVLLVSKKAIDYKKFNSAKVAVNWKNSTLRQWLNTKFLKKAFNDDERVRILDTEISDEGGNRINLLGNGNTTDKIFLLSCKEAERYFALESTRACQFTSYADLKIFSQLDHRTYSWIWWLRTNSPQKQGYVQMVYTNGRIGESSVIKGSKNGVRPAMWVKL